MPSSVGLVLVTTLSLSTLRSESYTSLPLLLSYYSLVSDDMGRYGYSLRTLVPSLSNKTKTSSVSPRVHQRYDYPIRRFSSSPSSASFENVGFIGLGNMGSRMANNLIKAGYKLVVHDINHDVMQMFTDVGASPKGTPSEVAEASEVVITMLPSPSHVLNVYSGPYGLLGGGNLVRSHLFIDSSTVDPQTSRKLSAMVSNYTSRGKEDDGSTSVMLDAPVSGGVLAAESGSLTFMVGGPEDAYLMAKPLLLSMGKSTIYCGGAGNGSAAKICNNLAMAVSMLGVSEALALGQSLGISASTLSRVFNSSSARCWSSDTYNPVPGVMDGVPSSRNYEGGFASKLMAKDLNLAVASAQETGLKFPVALQAKEIYKELCERGHENEDFSSIFWHYYSGKDGANFDACSLLHCAISCEAKHGYGVGLRVL